MIYKFSFFQILETSWKRLGRMPKNTHVGVWAPPGRPRGCLASPRPRPRTPTWAPTWAFWVSLGHGRGRGRLGDVLVFSHIIFGKLT